MTENFDNTRELLKAIREGKIPSERSREYWSDNERSDLTLLYLVDRDRVYPRPSQAELKNSLDTRCPGNHFFADSASWRSARPSI